MNLWVDYNRKVNGVTTLFFKEEGFVLKSSDRHREPSSLFSEKSAVLGYIPA